MVTILNTTIWIVTTLLFVILLWASLNEKEWRAVAISSIMVTGNSIIWWGLTNFQEIPWVITVNMVLIISAILYSIFALLKWFPKRKDSLPQVIPQYDERDHMFARNNLQYHPNLAERYYQKNPAKREIDEVLHKLPELLSAGGRYYDELLSPTAIAADSVTVATHAATKLKKAENRVNTDPKKITHILKQLGYFHGAAEIGITSLKPYHFYSHAGRQAKNWGEPITTNHSWAIAIMVPMKVEMLKKAPLLPAILESTAMYVETAKIAHIIANYIKQLGYDARAHFDGNYQVACVPVAKDAGLGEVGRLSILINPTYGPCIRLAVVTTDLELRVSNSNDQHHIEYFCDHCKKCAKNCPSNSIPSGEKPSERGFPHWSIDMESCYTFWKRMGTDCGICIRVCPYTKPNSMIHRLARFYVSRNPFNQKIALFLDNFLYRKKVAIATSNPDQTQTLP